ncbi:hypothetical protein XELAEV_18017682mg [Xenopus laevis]|uniref:Uncharacterized protein n=1 Tax=Xenopus laevis TaxID=8355 RepID=A0A974DE30_XENLA|nr:hypothetical protein XELAEV_18017682mg [Xenopus laevis]
MISLKSRSSAGCHGYRCISYRYAFHMRSKTLSDVSSWFVSMSKFSGQPLFAYTISNRLHGTFSFLLIYKDTSYLHS